MPDEVGIEPEVIPEEVKQEEVSPAESSTDETPAETGADETAQVSEDTNRTSTEVKALQTEKEKLLEEIMSLRGDRRQLRETKTQEVVQNATEDLNKDLNPQDIELFKKIAKATGYVSQEELNKKFYTEVKQEELNKFLNTFPEYKPENDKGDVNWSVFQNELRWYRMPENPREIGSLLQKVHHSLKSNISDRGAELAQRKSMETASIGSKGKGGTQQSSSLESFDQDKVWSLRSGGYTNEEITKILNKQNER